MATTDELIGRAKGGDLRAVEQVVSEMTRLIGWTASRWHIDGMEREDIEGECTYVLLSRAIPFWSGGRTVFSTYAVQCMENHLRDLARASIADKRTPPGGYLAELPDDETASFKINTESVSYG